MGVLLNYQDTIRLVKTTLPLNGYTTQIIEEIEEVDALFIQNTGWSHSEFQNQIDSDAELYIDPTNSFVIENVYRLEEMYVIGNLFSDQEENCWYKITSVSVGMDKLLNNQIDNILLQLKKTAEIPSVS